MADGATHARHARTVFRLLLMAWLLSGWLGPDFLLATLGLPVGAWMGRLISPDQDIHRGITFSERRLIRRWGPVGRGFVWWWNGYGARMAHRSRSSHALFIGTAGRLLYALCPPAFFLMMDARKQSRRITLTELLQTFCIIGLWLFALWGIVRLVGPSVSLGDVTPVAALWLAGVYVGWFIQDFVHLAADGWRTHR